MLMLMLKFTIDLNTLCCFFFSKQELRDVVLVHKVKEKCLSSLLYQEGASYRANWSVNINVIAVPA